MGNLSPPPPVSLAHTHVLVNRLYTMTVRLCAHLKRHLLVIVITASCSFYSSTLNMSTVWQLVAYLSNTTLKVPQWFRVKGVCECVSVCVCVCLRVCVCVRVCKWSQSCTIRLRCADPPAVYNSIFIIFLLVHDNINIVNIPCIFVLIYMHYHVSNHSLTELFVWWFRFNVFSKLFFAIRP